MVKSRDLSLLCDLSGETLAGPFATCPRLAFLPLLLDRVHGLGGRAWGSFGDEASPRR